MEYTRDELIKICERSIIPVDKWSNRDSPIAQGRVYKALGLLKANCQFSINYAGDDDDIGACVTDERTIWFTITYPNFGTFDNDHDHTNELFYLPTQRRLDECSGEDWY